MELEEYLKELEDIFDIAAQAVKYDTFLNSTKEYVGPALDRVKKVAKEELTRIYEEMMDIEMAEVLIYFQERITSLYLTAKISDELERDKIWRMSPGSIDDSKLYTGDDFDVRNFNN